MWIAVRARRCLGHLREHRRAERLTRLVPELRDGESLLWSHHTASIRRDAHGAERNALARDHDRHIRRFTDSQGEWRRDRAAKGDAFDAKRVAPGGRCLERERALLVRHRRRRGATGGIDERHDPAGNGFVGRLRRDPPPHGLRAAIRRQQAEA